MLSIMYLNGKVYHYISFHLFRLHHGLRILVPQPGIEPGPCQGSSSMYTFQKRFQDFSGGSSLVAPANAGDRFNPWSAKIPTCHGAREPVHHTSCAHTQSRGAATLNPCALEPVPRSRGSPHTAAGEEPPARSWQLGKTCAATQAQHSPR